MKKLLLLLFCLILTGPVYADNGQYLVLGSDLTPSEEQTVLDLLGVKNLNDYNVSYVTNAEEHEALGAYLPAEVIGSRALSSVLLTPNNKGIEVETDNINYVTKEMYQNALITAGLKNVKLKAVGPYPISGTAALTSAEKAYEIMTGEQVEQENVDVANDELVTTQDVADEVGQEDATELIAALKQQVVNEDLSEEQIASALDELEQKMDITLSPETKQQIIDLMQRIKGLDLDPELIRQQAENIYNNIKGYVDSAGGSGFLDSIAQAVKNFIDTIVNFFSGNSNVEQ